MRLDISDEVLRGILGQDELTAEEIRTIVRVAYVAAELDFHADVDERETLDALATRLWALARLPGESVAIVSPLPIDDEERFAVIRRLSAQLTSRGARELAYVMAYLLAAADVELAPVEARFLDDLQRALAISDERAADLVATTAEAATPGAGTDELRADRAPGP